MILVGGENVYPADIENHISCLEDVAEAIRWSVTLPEHFNVDSLVIRPVAQAANHKVHRTK